MNREDSELLLRVFASVFEDFAFMFVDNEPEEEPEQVDACVQASISFESKIAKGVMEVAAPLAFCNELAENILGTEEEELPEDAGQNALKEFLNVACGYFLAEKFGTELVFDLSIPETRQAGPDQWANILNDDAHIDFLVDESPMLARFVITA
jgi:hypothetical protein